MPDIDRATVRQCVLTAIDRVETAEQAWMDAEPKPRVGSEETPWDRWQRCEAQFGQQWRNVKALLEKQES